MKNSADVVFHTTGAKDKNLPEQIFDLQEVGLLWFWGFWMGFSTLYELAGLDSSPEKPLVLSCC